MRRRVLVLLIAALAAGALTLEATAVTAGASVSAKSHHGVVEKKKKKSKCDQAAIKLAYDYFLDGAKGYTPDQKLAYIQFGTTNQAFADQFTASASANAAASATTNVQVNSITCAKNGKSAQVAYDLVLNGQVAKGLVTAPGGAIKEKGTWKVTAETICNLQALGDPNVLASGPCADIINGTTTK